MEFNLFISVEFTFNSCWKTTNHIILGKKERESGIILVTNSFKELVQKGSVISFLNQDRTIMNAENQNT